jgi:four helix bundle protein
VGKGNKEFMYFLDLADSSLEETKYHLILSLDLTYVSRDRFDTLEQQCNEVGRMLYGLQQSIKNR